MKSYEVLLLFLVQAGILLVPIAAEVTCANNERKESCGHCPYYAQDGDVRQDLTLCGGDCHWEIHGNSQICVPNAIPGADTMTAQAAESSRPSNENLPADSNVPSSSILSENSVNIHTDASSSTLSEITVHIANSHEQRRPRKIRFKAEVCIEHACCQTETLYKRSGIFKFSQNFQNLGQCRQFTRGYQKEVQVRAIRISRQWTSLQVVSVTAHFDDGSLLTAQNVRRDWWGRSQQYYLPWDTLWGTEESTVRVSDNVPDPHCPEMLMTNVNVCPKANVRVHNRLADSRKFCYYQECDTFSADLSRIGTEQLGSGGYCIPKTDQHPQYEYCCDLEQYFTTPERTEREDVNFPRCLSMNTTRNDI